MDINELIAIVKKKLQDQIKIESINIEDKSFLHKNHASNQEGKFHLKINLKSIELKKMNRIEIYISKLARQVMDNFHTL